MAARKTKARNPQAMIPAKWTTAKVRRVNGRVQVKVNPSMRDLQRAGVRIAKTWTRKPARKPAKKNRRRR